MCECFEQSGQISWPVLKTDRGLQMPKPGKSHLLNNKGVSGIIDETFVLPTPKVKAYTTIDFMPLSNNPTGCRVRDITQNGKHQFLLQMQRSQYASIKKRKKWNIVNAFNLLFFEISSQEIKVLILFIVRTHWLIAFWTNIFWTLWREYWNTFCKYHNTHLPEQVKQNWIGSHFPPVLQQTLPNNVTCSEDCRESSPDLRLQSLLRSTSTTLISMFCFSPRKCGDTRMLYRNKYSKHGISTSAWYQNTLPRLHLSPYIPGSFFFFYFLLMKAFSPPIKELTFRPAFLLFS